MAKSAEVDDPSQQTATGTATPTRRKNETVDTLGVPPLLKYRRRPELSEELRRWYALDDPDRLDEIKRAAAGEKRWSIETFVHAVRQAWAFGDQRAYVQTFNALATRAAGLLITQAEKQNAGEGEDHAQNVLELTAKEVQAGKAEYAEANFADYALRKAIDAYRREDTRLESKLDRATPREGDESGDGPDPVDEVADRIPSPEARALLKHSIGKLEGNLRNVFIEYHVHGLTYEEIAEQHDKDESTIRIWVKRAGELVGHQGGKNDRED